MESRGCGGSGIPGTGEFRNSQRLIQTAIDEGGVLVTGGTGRPAGIETGYFVRPTVFGDVTPAMTIAREEVFGSVLAILPYGTIEHAITIANDTVYGLASYELRWNYGGRCQFRGLRTCHRNPRSTSPIPTAHGSAAATKTPTA